VYDCDASNGSITGFFQMSGNHDGRGR
jgi:hypothetical protein